MKNKKEMKKVNDNDSQPTDSSNRWLKNVGSLSGYWLLFVLTPLFLAISLKRNSYSNQLDISGFLSLYVLFLAPVLFIIPYKLAKLSNQIQKRLFLLFGLILPYLILYLFIYLDFKKNFHPGF